MFGKCIIVPQEQELVPGCLWGHPAALLGWLSPGEAERAEQKSCGQGGGREHSSSLYCTFRVSLQGRDMEHPLPWHGWAPQALAALPQAPWLAPHKPAHHL